eukprot:5455918-Prymnesium_polylepis.1
MEPGRWVVQLIEQWPRPRPVLERPRSCGLLPAMGSADLGCQTRAKHWRHIICRPSGAHATPARACAQRSCRCACTAAP